MPTQNNEFNQYVNDYNTARNDTVSTKYFNIGLNNVLDFFGAGRPLQEYVIKQRPLKEYYPMHKYCKTNTRECAEWANDYLRKTFKYDAWGNAWNHGNTKPVINGYEGLDYNPKETDLMKILNYEMQAADNLKKRFNVNELNPEKQYRVNMYFAPSAYMIDAYRDGNSWTRGSHTGILRNEKGKWYVIHNFHGDVIKDPLNDLIGSNYNIGITSISSILRKHGGQLLPKCFRINSITKRRFI